MKQFKILIIALALFITGTSISLPTNTTETFAATKTVKLNRKSLTLKEGQLYRLELLNKKVRAWKTTNKKVATVTWGLVQGKGAGTCYIKVYPVKSSKVYKCKVTVTSKNGKSSTTETKKPETKPTETKTPVNTNTVHFKEENNLLFDQYYQLHLLDENGNDISDQAKWTSDEFSLVSNKGFVVLVKAYKSGATTTTITATYEDRKYSISLIYPDWKTADETLSIQERKEVSRAYDLYRPLVPDTIIVNNNKYGRCGWLQEDNTYKYGNYFKYLTEQEFTQILEQIKTQYPAGTYWGFDTEYTPKFGGVPIDACSGFVAMVTDTAVGCTSDIGSFRGMTGTCWEIHKVNSPSELKLYDIVEYLNHVAIITGFTENGVLVCEGNHGAEVHWDCEQSYDDIFEWNNVYAGSFINH